MRFLISFGLCAAFVAAAPTDLQPEPTEVVNRLNADLGIAYGGALDFPMPLPTAPAKLANVPGPHEFTVSLIMAHTKPITSIHVEGKGSQKPVGGSIKPGTTKNMTITSFVVPRDYYGNIAFNNAGSRVDTGDESLIELSFRNQNGIYTPDIDVSYVNGFSVPISCFCTQDDANGHVEDHTSGCSKDLFSLHSCPNDNGHGSCKNPRRFDVNNHTPTEFFAPCHRYGGAYTYPKDDMANTLNGGRCRDSFGGALCCIGHYCSGWESYPRK